MKLELQGIMPERVKPSLLWAAALFVPCALLMSSPSPVQAQDGAYPERSIRFIVPWSPGGQNDIWARVLAQEVSDERFNLVVENIAGATGIVGMQAVASAEPDGYTIGQASGSTLAVIAQGAATFDSDDLQPLVLAGTEPMILVVGPDSRFENAEQLLDAMESGEVLTIGTPGTQNINHLFAQTLGYITGSEYAHIPYPGGAQVLTDLRGGQIDAAVLGPALALQNIDSGTIKGLALFASERLAAAPDLPTFAESGYDVFPFGPVNQISYLVAPAGLPDEIADILIEKFQSALASESVRDFADRSGNTLIDLSGDALAAEIADVQNALTAAVVELFADE